MKKNATNKELKIKDLFNLAERTNEGAYITTLENGNNYCFGYYDGTETREDVLNAVKRVERRVTASMSRRDLNANIFADDINRILLWWRDNLDKYPVIAKAAKQLKRIEDKINALEVLNTRINNHEQTAEIVKYNGIRKEINQAISARKREYLNIRARYTRILYRAHSWQLLKSYDIIDIYNALPANWEEMAKHGIKSVNTDLLPHVKDQKEPIKLEPTMVEPETIEEPTMVEPETIEEPTMVEPETIEEPTMVEPETIEEPTMVEPEIIEEPTMVEPETVEEPTMAEPETIEEPTITHTLHMWIMSTAAAAVACLIVFISLSIKPHTAATAAPTVATIEEPTMVEPTMVECETIDHINDVICTGSIDTYYNRVKEEITRNYRESMKSQLQELADLASVDDSEVIAALADPETDPETPESVPTVETIQDTENTPESVEIMPTETDTETDAGMVSDTDTIDYNSSEYVELTVITTDANGNQVVNVYSVPLNE